MNRSLILALSIVILAVAASRGASPGLQQPSRPASQPPLRIAMTEKGFQPSSLPVRLNVPVKIAFVRQTDDLCATEVLIPEYNIKLDLPLNQPVTVELTPKKTGEIVFVCGLMAFKGTLVVTEK